MWNLRRKVSMNRNLAVLAASLFLAGALAGCTSDDSIRIAFVAKDTATAPHEGLDALEAYLEDATGRDTTVTFFTSHSAALAALDAGQADVASVDGAAAWLAWKTLGLEAIGSEVRGDGRTHYIASAWVRNDSAITTVDDLAGANSCHTGPTKSAGMFMPMSYLVREGKIDASAYADDISQVQEMAKDYFGVATIGGAYEGYEGGLRCLSDGTGDVAFIRDTTPADYCAPENVGDRDWCLELDDYRELVQFGPVPEHPFMVSPHQDAGTIALIANALFAMDETPEGQAILDATFGTSEIRAVTTADHLSGYGDLIGQLPGITAYAEGQ